MAGSTRLHEVLGALRAELREAPAPKAERHTSAPEETGPAAQADASVADLEEQLRELGKALSDYTGGVEDFVREHPLVSVAAAFALGIAIGRMMGRV
jgi:ElaB/YqjD/DUF883 family membrane-anchored ribosome-binding protein